jgi:hypothetical protein
VHAQPAPTAVEGNAWSHGREGTSALRVLPVLGITVVAIGVATTIESGTWMVGVPELVRSELGHVPGGVLGRVMGLISLIHRGAHATGLMFVSPLFAFFSPRPIFVAAALAAPPVGIGALAALVLSRRADEARGRVESRSPRS